MLLLKKDGIYNLYRHKKGFIVVNTKLPFESGHTHVRGIKQANDLIVFAKTGKFPSNYSTHMLESLRRICGYEQVATIDSILTERQDDLRVKYLEMIFEMYCN